MHAQPFAPTRPALRSTHQIHGSTVQCWTYLAQQPSRGVILAVHGFRGDHHGLIRLIEELPAYTVIVPDLPGFGTSTPFGAAAALHDASVPLDEGIPAHDAVGYGQVIAALREDLGLDEQTILLGHSFGSIVASDYLAKYPAHFSQLVLINPICEPALEGDQALMSKAAGLYYWAGAILPKKLGEGLLRSRLITDITSLAMLKSKDPAMRHYVFDQHRRYFSGFTSRATLREAYGASITQTVRDVAARINNPTLLVVGEKDELGSIPAQKALARSFPRGLMRVIADVGHLIHYEKAPEAAALINEFLTTENPWKPKGMPRILHTRPSQNLGD
ncbi:alpha/beta hydrolase [Arthrobacter sp. MYb227]|uniref:alpha/beta fold hydrolase n=1 Tax=Arthrobacter sp. MYb227 TaxID=1848601 RepID=UPI000CFE1249|nr:alpha/beta hydrolase [Arthrobacter sp. MYb227]PQZ93828.1 alpha/beta hydrolase [Arthrobacter sp. MYb227]